MSLAMSISILFISLLPLSIEAQCLNITPLFLSSACLAAASSPSSVIVVLNLMSLLVLYALLD